MYPFVKHSLKHILDMKDFWKTACIFAGGAAVGAAVAMFLTPESGKELREDARRLAGEAKQRLQDYYEQLRSNIDKAAENANTAIEEEA